MRLTQQQEQIIAREIHRFDSTALEAIQTIPNTDSILNETTKRPEKTRAGALDRLSRAIENGNSLFKNDPDFKDALHTARNALSRARSARIPRGRARSARILLEERR